jgi:phosphomannomutase
LLADFELIDDTPANSVSRFRKPEPMFDPTLFQRKADVRGIYPNQINEELAWFTGRYLALAVKELAGATAPKILVGRDGRLSSPNLYAALCQGIVAGGASVIPCGLATTDMIQWGAGEQLGGAVAGAMVTASHNPPEYNGIKMLVRNAKTKGIDIVRPVDHLAKYLAQDSGSAEAPAQVAAPFPGSASLNLHAKFVDAACKVCPDIAKTTGRVVLDPGNGVGGLFVPLLRQALAKAGSKAEVHAVAEAIDGRFPTRPSNPGLPGAVKLLQETVISLGAKFGAAFDGDADRVFLVDEWGQFVPGSLLLAALADSAVRAAVKRGVKSPAVVYAAVASWLVVETVRKAGGKPIICRVGQDAAKVALIDTQAVFGGESSAHYNFPDAYCLDSGLFAMMTFWQMLLTSGQSCSELLGGLSPWPNSGEVNLRIESSDWKSVSAELVKTLQAEYSKPDANAYVLTIDGVGVYSPRNPKFATVDDVFTVDAKGDPKGTTYRVVADGYTPDWWFNVRASNNEPLVRLNVEAKAAADVTARTYSLISQIQKFCAERSARAVVQDWGSLRG